MSDNLGQNFKLVSLFRFVAPAILTYLFIATFQMVDGFFIAKYVGDIAVAAVNVIYPVISFLCAVSIMLGTGGNAFIVKKVGENKSKEANNAFSVTVIAGTAVGLITTILCLLFTEQFLAMLGASAGNIEYIRPYYFILLACSPLIILSQLFGILLIGEGHATRAAVVSIASGIINLVLDYVFMRHLNMGIMGAALATGLGYLLATIYLAIYYFKGKGAYRFLISKLKFHPLLQICFNGSSEMISSMSASVTVLMMNLMIFKYYGEEGVSALTVVIYFQFLLQAVFMGFTTSVSPVFSYHYGSGNIAMRKRVFRLSLILIAILTLGIFVITLTFNSALVEIFFRPGTQIFNIARDGLLFVLGAGLFAGFSIFASGLFTAFSNGLVSGILSFVRTFLFLVAALWILPQFFGITGLWLAQPVAEFLSVIVSFFYVIFYRKKYQYQ